MWVVSVDSSGNPVAQRTYGGGGRDEIYSLQPTSDGGFITVGLSTSFGAAGHAPLVLKFDASGTIQWQKTYIVAGRDWGNAIRQTRDGGYVIAGGSDPVFGGPGHERAAVIKLDASGNIQWQKTYGTGTDCENTADILQTPDDGYIVAAVTICSFGAGSSDIWLLKLDTSGNIQWQKTYGGNGAEGPGSIRPTADGGWIVAGYTSSFGAGGLDAWVLKLNANGSVAWQKAYGGSGDDTASYAEQTRDGGYIVSGSTTSFGSRDIWVLKLDSTGNILWQRSYDTGSSGEESRAVHQTADGGYVVAGFTDIGFNPPNANFTVLKLASDGSVAQSCPFGIGRPTNATVQNTSATILDAPATAAPGSFRANTTNMMTTVTSAQANTLCASANRPPVANAGPDQTVECSSHTGTPVTLDGSASSDPDGDTLTFQWTNANNNIIGNTAMVNVTAPLGANAYTLKVTDPGGLSATATTHVTVRDTTPPTLSVSLTPNVLSPPNHKLVLITASIQVSDICDPHPTVVLVSITSNEPLDPRDVQGAVFGTDSRSFFLRAKTSGRNEPDDSNNNTNDTGDNNNNTSYLGRVYTVKYRAMDASGNMTFATATVTVPHDQR